MDFSKLGGCILANKIIFGATTPLFICLVAFGEMIESHIHDLDTRTATGGDVGTCM